MKYFKTNHVFWPTLIIAAALSSAISLYIGLRQSVWFDEAYSILLAQHSWSEIVRLTAQDVHPPVYYWLLKIWMMIFGSGELALRSMSVLFLGASIIMAGLLLRKIFGSKTALLALPFVVLAPFLLRYGFEIRMYSLASFIGIGATYILVQAIEETAKQKRLLLFIVYGLLVALGVYTLYFMALVWIAHLTWLLWLAYTKRQKELVLYGAGSYAAAFLLFIPWLPIFISKAGGGTLSSVTHQLDLENLYGMVTFLFLYQPSWQTSALTASAVVFIIGAVLYLAVSAYKNIAPRERQYLSLLGMYFLIPVLTLIVVTYFKPVYLERYMAQFAIGAYAGVGAIVALAFRSGDKLLRVLGGLLGVLLVIGCVSLAQYGNYNFQRVHTPSVKQVATLLGDCKNGATIFADGPQLAMELMYYETDCPVYFFNETLEMGGGFAMLSGSSQRVANASELPQTNKILYVYYNKPKQSIPNYFDERSTVKIGAVSVARYVKR